jgi:hypothetical protein
MQFNKNSIIKLNKLQEVLILSVKILKIVMEEVYVLVIDILRDVIVTLDILEIIDNGKRYSFTNPKNF